MDLFDFVQYFGILFAQNYFFIKNMTKYITLSDYRNNISRYTREAREKKISYIVLIHSKPAFEVRPVDEDMRELVYPEWAHEKWLEARAELARGEAVNWEDIAHKFR